MILRLVLTALVLAALFWYIQPLLVSPPPTPTATVPPTRTAWPTPTYTDTPTTTLTPTNTSTPTATPFCVWHSVAGSESVEIIAEKYGAELGAILWLNRLSAGEELRIGQQLCIPVDEGSVLALTPPPTATPTPLTHVVARGDSLGSIADHYDTTVALLVEANELAEGQLLPIGTELIVPQIFPTPTPAPPTPTWTLTPVPPTPRPTLTETPRTYYYQRPVLLHPSAGTTFRGPDQTIVLAWSSVAMLADNEWYSLAVHYVEDGIRRNLATVRTKETSWWMPVEEYRFSESFHRIEWRVTAVREEATGALVAISPPSTFGWFDWY